MKPQPSVLIVSIEHETDHESRPIVHQQTTKPDVHASAPSHSNTQTNSVQLGHKKGLWRTLQIGLSAPFFYTFLSILSPISLLLLWRYASQQQWLPEQILVPPATVWLALIELIQSGELRLHLQDSLFRLVTGFSLGMLSGIAFGVVFAVSRGFRAYFGLLFEVLRQIPVLVLIPMFILFFGIGETLKIVLLLKAVFFPIALATIEAVRNIPRQYIELGQVYQLKRWTWFRHIVFPATLPPIVSGIRISLGRAWLVLVAVELLAAGTGIGQMMEMGRQLLRLDVVMVGVIMTGLIGFLLDKGLRLFERHFNRWQAPKSH